MNKFSRVLLTALGIVFSLALVLVIVAYSSSIVNAQQEQSVSIKFRLEQLRDQMEAGNIMIDFQFVAPISEGDNFWLFGDKNDENKLTFVEIADNHFCFSQTSAQAVLIRCVPYSIIASFDYLGT